MSRKRRSDSFSNDLTVEQRDQLFDWLAVDNISHKEAAQLCWSEFDVRTSASAVSDWFSSYSLRADLLSAVRVAEALKADLQELPAGIGLDDETISRAAQAKFEAEVAKSGDVKAHVLLRNTRLREKELAANTAGARAKLEQRDRQITQKDRELELSREKFQAQEARNQAAREKLAAALSSRGGIAPETVAQIEEALRLL